jgi:hypothetical protein
MLYKEVCPLKSSPSLRRGYGNHRINTLRGGTSMMDSMFQGVRICSLQCLQAETEGWSQRDRVGSLHSLQSSSAVGNRIAAPGLSANLSFVVEHSKCFLVQVESFSFSLSLVEVEFVWVSTGFNIFFTKSWTLLAILSDVIFNGSFEGHQPLNSGLSFY